MGAGNGKGGGKKQGGSRTAAAPGKSREEKRQTAYLFACAGGMLWVVPALSSLFIGILTDGMTAGFGLAIAALILGIPNSLFALSAYRKKAHRGIVIACDALLIALHLVTAFLIRPWYVILSPALILLAVMIAVSDVITSQDHA